MPKAAYGGAEGAHATQEIPCPQRSRSSPSITVGAIRPAGCNLPAPRTSPFSIVTFESSAKLVQPINGGGDGRCGFRCRGAAERLGGADVEDDRRDDHRPGGGGGAVEAALHLPRPGADQEPAQQQGVPAGAGVAGSLPPRRPGAGAHGGAQAPGRGAPGEALGEAAAGVRGRRGRGRGPAAGRLQGPRRRVARRGEPGPLRGAHGHRRLLPGGGHADGRAARQGARRVRAQRPRLQQVRLPLPLELHPVRHGRRGEPAAAAPPPAAPARPRSSQISERFKSQQAGARFSLSVAPALGRHQPPGAPPTGHPVHEPHPRRPPRAHGIDGIRHAVSDGDLRGRDPLQGERHRQPPGRALRAGHAEHAGDQGGRQDGEVVPEPDGVRAAPPGRWQRRDGVRDLHGQHHQLGRRRGAAEVQEHHRVRAGQRRGGGQAAQQHAQQGRSDEPVQQAPRRAAPGQGPVHDEEEQVASQLHSEVPQESLGVHLPRRRRRAACGHSLADCVYCFAIL